MMAGVRVLGGAGMRICILATVLEFGGGKIEDEGDMK